MTARKKNAARRPKGKGRDNGKPGPAEIAKLREGDPDKSSWEPVDLSILLEGGELEVPPALLGRSDGACLVYKGKVRSFAGEPEAGKDWLMLFASSEQLGGGEHVVYIDLKARRRRPWSGFSRSESTRTRSPTASTTFARTSWLATRRGMSWTGC